MVKRKTFTLIELLVVISIIAILISILLPALSSARGSARMIACASKIRQIGLGVLMYSQAFDDFMPPDGVYNRNGKSSRGRDTWWPCLIYEYATSDSQPKNPGGGYDDRYWRFNAGFGNNLFCCPDAEQSIQAKQNVHIEGSVSYGMNMMAFSANPFTSEKWFTRTTEVLDPSTTIWATDSSKVPGVTYSLMTVPGWWSQYYHPGLRHLSGAMGVARTAEEWVPQNGGKANAWFVDGHVQAIGYDEIVADNKNLFRGTPKNAKR